MGGRIVQLSGSRRENFGLNTNFRKQILVLRSKVQVVWGLSAVPICKRTDVVGTGSGIPAPQPGSQATRLPLISDNVSLPSVSDARKFSFEQAAPETLPVRN